MQHPDVGGDRLQRLFEIRLVVAEDCICLSDRRRVNGHASLLRSSTILVARRPHRAQLCLREPYSRPKARELLGG